MLNIGLNKQLDIEIYNAFYNLKIGGVDFGAKILQDHPDITDETAKTYINNYYNEHQKDLAQAATETTKHFESLQKPFFQYLENLFGIDFHQEIYQGFLSIFDCNPRFVEKGEFQIFYKRTIENKIGVIFHEVLHFAFFKYCDTKLSKQTANLDKNSGPLWELSEIFNVIIMNEPEFQILIPRKEKLFYPDLEKTMDDLVILWKKNNLEQFIIKGLKRLS